MGNEVSPDYMRGFLIPNNIDESCIDTAASNFTQQGNQAGDPQESEPTELLVRATGEQTADSDLQIKTERAGHPTAGGQFVWVDNAATSDDIGRMLPSNISNYDIAKASTASTYKYTNPNVLALKNGDMLVSVFASEPAFVTPKIKIFKRTEDDDTYTDIQVANISSIYGGISTPTTYTAMCVLPNDDLLLIYNVSSGVSYSPDGKLNFKAYVSKNNGDDWDLYSNRCIDDDYDLGTGTGEYTVEGIQIQSLNGQILMIVETRYGTTTEPKNRLLQYASIDNGATFTRVTSANDFENGYHKIRLSVYKGSFFVSYIAEQDELHTMVLPHAFFPIATARNAEFYTIAYLNSGGDPISNNASVNDLEGGELALIIDDDDLIYIYFRICQLTGEERYISMYSLDNETYDYMSNDFDNADWYKLTDNTGTVQRPINIQGAAINGRIAIAHNFETALTIGNTLSVIFMGGYSSLTYPFLDDSKDRYKKITYDTTYLPFDLPSTISQFTPTSAGTPSESINQGRYKLDTDTVSSKYYQSVFTTDIQEGLIIRCRFDADTGGSLASDGRFIAAEIGDNVERYGVVVRTTTTTIQVNDMHGSSIASTTIGENVNEVIIAIRDNNTRVYLCKTPEKHYKSFELVASTSALTDGGAGLSNGVVQFGHGVFAGNVITYWYEFMVSSAERTGLGMDEYSPDLSAMNYPPTGKFLYIADGVRITTVNGPAKLGDEYQIQTRYMYGIENVFYKNQPSIKSGWRSETVSTGTSVPTQQIAITSLTDAQGSPFSGNAIMAIHLQGINCQQIKIFSKIGAGAYTEQIAADTKFDTFNYDVQANTITPNLSSDATGPYINFNECKNWILKLTDGTDTIFTRIVSNTEGTLASATTKKPIFFVDKGVTIPSTGTTGTREADLIPTSMTILMYMNNTYTYDGLRIDFMSTITPEDYIECSHISIGPVVFPGQQYGRGRTISANGGTISEQLLNGVRYSRNVRPTQKRVRLSWSDPIDITTISGDAVDPDYWTSIIGYVDPIATDKDVPFLMLGVLDRLQGTKSPLVYLPKIEKISTGSGILHALIKRTSEHMLSIMTSDVSIESVLGDENVDEIFRVSTITLEEIV